MINLNHKNKQINNIICVEINGHFRREKTSYKKKNFHFKISKLTKEDIKITNKYWELNTTKKSNHTSLTEVVTVFENLDKIKKIT
ncbi:hypothetical protein, partial [Mycoplasma leonicaptivi]|uniref:hypothetical protein n=3 Tax=Mycoplasma leonicaptivi TaxID=36742 RepID=UPI0004810565